MKKSTVLIVLVTFVLSVVLVGIFGMKVLSYNTRIYVKEIVPVGVTTSSNVAGVKCNNRRDEKGDPIEGKYIVIVPYSDGLIVRIDYELTPADATDKDVSITPLGGADVVEVDGLSIRVKRIGSTTLLYRAKDGSNCSIEITLQAWDPDEYYGI